VGGGGGGHTHVLPASRKPQAERGAAVEPATKQEAGGAMTYDGAYSKCLCHGDELGSGIEQLHPFARALNARGGTVVFAGEEQCCNARLGEGAVMCDEGGEKRGHKEKRRGGFDGENQGEWTKRAQSGMSQSGVSEPKRGLRGKGGRTYILGRMACERDRMDSTSAADSTFGSTMA
jgi:hypothetical protein